MKENKITVIIPAYNTEKYIEECIMSVLKQTYQNFEILIIDDGSTDNTLKVINDINDNRIKVFSIENNGQGFARNLMLKKATGDYIMFLDSDDFIEPVTLEVALKRIISDGTDFVYFDWKYYNNQSKKYSYTSREKFFHKSLLINEECKQLLDIQSYFTVNKLYNKKFLLENNIFYGEHYIYEDIVFWVKVCMNAKNVSIIQSPLYNVRINSNSTTKTNFNTDKHMVGFLKAYDDCIQLVSENEGSLYFFLSYMLRKFLLYYNFRTPKKFKNKFINEFFERIKIYDVKKFNKEIGLTKVIPNYNFLDNLKKFKLFSKVYHYKKYYKKIMSINSKIKSNIKSIMKGDLILYKNRNKNLKKQVLFMGFDYRYTGNSRYFYEMLLNKKNIPIYFVTDDELVEKKKRIKPKSRKFYKELYSSKIVIFESWIPKGLRKPNNAIWINLWHGTPLKKMLYDSSEKEIVLKKISHKREKFNSIQKFDYLLVDNKNIDRYFETSFLIDSKKLLNFGYPRVEYLLKNKKNEKLKKEIRKKINIDEHKKIIMYFPTWRDYNYGVLEEELDFNYFLDQNLLLNYLNDEKYVIISKDHTFLRKNKDVTMTNLETQELLLISDFVITDYSSVMFDAFAINIPVCIISKDYEKYIKSRGLYEDIWEDLKPFLSTDEKELSNMIKNYTINSNYKKIQKKYCYKSDGDLTKFVIDKLNNK